MGCYPNPEGGGGWSSENFLHSCFTTLAGFFLKSLVTHHTPMIHGLHGFSVWVLNPMAEKVGKVESSS